MTPVVEAAGVGVRFQFDRQRRLVTPTLARLRRRVQETWALHGVGLAIRPGESVALLGQSGAGKTTLLRCLAGVLAPDAGRVATRGPVASLLSVDAGLLPALTGRENAILVAVLHGIPAARAREAAPAIAAATALGEAFDRPVSSYSQGMRARLGFAVATLRRPRLLLLDEVHEALDHEYRQVVDAEAAAVAAAGGAVVAAGHDHALLERLCERAILLERGTLVADGPFADVHATYLERLERRVEAVA